MNQRSGTSDCVWARCVSPPIQNEKRRALLPTVRVVCRGSAGDVFFCSRASVSQTKSSGPGPWPRGDDVIAHVDGGVNVGDGVFVAKKFGSSASAAPLPSERTAPQQQRGETPAPAPTQTMPIHQASPAPFIQVNSIHSFLEQEAATAASGSSRGDKTQQVPAQIDHTVAQPTRSSSPAATHHHHHRGLRI